MPTSPGFGGLGCLAPLATLNGAVPSVPSPFATPAALLEHVEALGWGRFADARLVNWFDASRLSPLTQRIVQRLALTRGCGTPRALLGEARVWDALGPTMTRATLDDLGDWLAEEAARQGLPSATAGASVPGPLASREVWKIAPETRD